MKYAVAIAPENALPSAFVVFRGFRQNIPLAAELGYKGVELALRSTEDINPDELDKLLVENGMEVCGISTGQVYAEYGLSLTDTDAERTDKLIQIFFGLIDLASSYGKKINLGRVRGNLDAKDRDRSLKAFAESIQKICGYAASRGVDLLLEPVNRYELNFINNLEDGHSLLTSLEIPNLGLMADVFHMNIEDASITGELEKYFEWVKYLHFADSNRLAPGWGHTDFKSIIGLLEEKKYTGWISFEMLPEPNPMNAARQAIQYLESITKN
jgi:sugar phosphate isomerase/epimerase